MLWAPQCFVCVNHHYLLFKGKKRTVEHHQQETHCKHDTPNCLLMYLISLFIFKDMYPYSIAKNDRYRWNRLTLKMCRIISSFVTLSLKKHIHNGCYPKGYLVEHFLFSALCSQCLVFVIF